jgi:DNA-binding CsgD family transcriptional regulator/tetratricopeptide (TPR) repeat protein
MIGPTMPARLSSPVLIGRVPEMATLRHALARAGEGEPVVILVGGEAGIGKTRLVLELADQARTQGGVVLEGNCVNLGSDEGLPFAPVAEALRGLVRDGERSALAGLIDPATQELARLVPELLADGRELPPDLPSDWAQTRLFEGFLILLERLGQQRPVTVVVEDVHWADRSTLDLLAFIARRLRGERVLVIATYRSDELHRRHPLRPWLAELRRLPRVEHVELDRFDRAEVAQQLSAIHGDTVPTPLIDLIARRSEGNPFFAEELLAAGSADQATVPTRLRDVLLGRVGLLSAAAGRVLDAVSVAGGTVDHDLLRAVLHLEEDALAMALDEATSSQLLRPTADAGWAGSYAFRHALLGEAIHDELLESERRRLHAAYAAALDARPTPDGAAGASHLARLAHHAAAANDLALALRASIASARASGATWAFHEAARAFERAIALWESVPVADRPAEEDYVELLYETSGALDTALEPQRAREAAQLAVDSVDAAREPVRSARLIERLAWAVYLTNDLAAGIHLLQQAVVRLDGLPPSEEAAACLASLANFTLYAGRYRDAIPIAERAISISDAVGAMGRKVWAMGALGASLALTGDCARGLSVLRDALAVADDLGDPELLGMAYLGLSSTLYDCDDLEESVAVGLAGAAWASGLRLPGFSAMPVEGQLPLGRYREAEVILRDLTLRSVGAVGDHWDRVFAGIIAVRTGQLAEAQVLPQVRQDAPELLADVAFAGNLAGGLIELALAEDRLLDGRLHVDEGLDWLKDADDIRFRARVLRLAVSIEADIAAVARARRDEAGETIARELGVARADRLRELMAGTDDTSPVFAEARGNLALAEAEVTRLLNKPDPAAWSAAADRFLVPRRPYELAWCRYREAEALLAVRASRAAASAATGEALALAEGIGAAPLVATIARFARMARLEVTSTPVREPPLEPGPESASGRTDEPDDPFGLTEREREVLTLLVAGETNRRIAETLFISESTASVHVSNIIGKLGVSNRVEAAAAAVRSGLAE